MSGKVFSKRRAVLFMLALFLLFPAPLKVYAAQDIVVHYQRADGDYGPWNIWCWAEGGEGAAYNWTGEDAFGKFAEITLPVDAASAGFIVRTDAWVKDTEADRFIDLSQTNEIWVYSGQEEFLNEAPEGFAEEPTPLPNLTVKAHYSRYDGNDGAYHSTEASLWFPDGTGVSVTGDYPADFFWAGYGIDFDFNAGEGLTTADKLSVSFQISGVSTPVIDGFNIPLRNAVVSEDGLSSTLEVYCEMGSNKITVAGPDGPVFARQEVSLESVLDAPDLININTGYPIKAEDGVQQLILVDYDTRETVAVKETVPLNEGGTDETYGELLDGYATKFQMSLAESLPLDRNHEMIYGTSSISSGIRFGNIYASEGFAEMFTYEGELGAVYTPERTEYRLWSPAASGVQLILDGDMVFDMERGENGTWFYVNEGDDKGTPYVFSAHGREFVDPYAKAVGINGTVGVVTDLNETNPEGWENDARPALASPVDAVIYEIHVRDFSSHESSGMENKGKFLAFTETGTQTPDGLSTGVDHLKELGVTHIHLLPSFDYASLDESAADPGFNWGYDPLNYNAPEGTYSTNAADPNTRISEYKQMVQALHNENIGVIMDVVYNHTATAENNNLSSAVPNYYYRLTAEGGFSNGSGCGNEIASERSMVRKMIVDSVVHWAKEYHVDGFRFDLMGLHDIETMNLIRAELDKIDPQIVMYGEGWTAGTTTLPSEQSALKANMARLDSRIAAFSDDIRDGIKGSVFDATDPGFVNGYYSRKEQIKFGVAASVEHPQIDTSLLANAGNFWAAEPTQTVTYDSAHDNLTLWDKIKAASLNATEEDLLAMNRMAAAIVLTSQGIPFLHAGEEIARTKGGDHNSYISPDSVNQIRWDTKAQYAGLFEYYKGLIALRKAHPAFRMTTADDIRANLTFLDTTAQIAAYTLNGSANGDGEDTILVAFNADAKERELTLPKAGQWAVLVDGTRAGTEAVGTVTGDTLTLTGRSAYVLTYEGEAPEAETLSGETASEATEQDAAAPSPTEEAAADETAAEPEDGSNLLVNAVGGIAAVAGIAFVILGIRALLKKGKKQ